MEVTTAAMARAARSEDRVVTTSRDDAVAIVLADGFCNAMLEHLEKARDWFDVRALAAVLESVDKGLAAGETTAVVVIVSPYALAGVSVGDSEAWVIRDARIDVLTSRQSRARLGSKRVQPVIFHRRSLEGTLVVGSDGLFKHVAREAIARSCDEAESLVVLPKLASGEYPDDVAIAVLR